MPTTAATTTLVETLRRRGARYELAVMRRLLAALGSPERELSVVLVGGTNGKGSVAALLAAIAEACGSRAGLYTSPHLEAVEECFRWRGQSIAPAELERLLTEVVKVGEAAVGTELTYFEAFTAAALVWFKLQGAKLAIVEVGLGGRLDATNVCEPILSILTSIGRDHMAELGPDLASITRHKAGIFRSGRPAIVAGGADEVMAVLRAEASRLGTQLVESEWAARWSRRAEGGVERVWIETETSRCELVSSLLGAHQTENLALAVLAAEALARLGHLRLEPGQLDQGLAGCRWPGRLEWVDLPGGGRVLLDGAHNAEGAAVLESFLGELDCPYDLLFGAFRDKEVEVMLPALARRAGRVVLTRAPGPRGLAPEDLFARLEGRVFATPPVLEADLAIALERGLEGQRLLVVCGSLALVGEVRQELRRRLGVPAPAVAPLFPCGDKMPHP